MKSFKAHTQFSIKNEEEFNRYMSDRVKFWAARLEKKDSPLNPVEMALGDAIAQGLVESVVIIDYQPVDYTKSMAAYRAEYYAPEAFRALFAEV